MSVFLIMCIVILFSLGFISIYKIASILEKNKSLIDNPSDPLINPKDKVSLYKYMIVFVIVVCISSAILFNYSIS